MRRQTDFTEKPTMLCRRTAFSLRYKTATIVLFLLLTFSFQNIFSQGFEFLNYKTEEGLAQDYIYAIEQDDAGYLWIGTGEGLCKFNGLKFEIFTKENGLAENFTKVIHIDHLGKIYLGHYEGGVTVYKNNVFRSLKKKENIASPINTIYTNKKGVALAGSQSNGVLIIDNDSLKEIKTLPSIKTVTSIAETNENTFLLGTDEGLYQLNFFNGRFIQKEKSLLLANSIISITKSYNPDEYFILTREGLFRYNFKSQSTLVQIHFPADFDFMTANALLIDSKQSLFISSQGHGVYKFNLNEDKAELTEHIDKASGLSSNYIKATFIDREYNIWIGTYGNGFDKLEKPELKTISLPSNETLPIRALCIDKKSVWVATEKELLEVEAKTGNVFKNIALPKEVSSISFLLKKDTKSLLIGTHSKGIYKMDILSGQISNFFFKNDVPSANRINHILKDNKGNIWIASSDGVFVLDNDGKLLRNYSISDGLLHNIINSIFMDDKLNVWVVSEGPGIARFDGEKFILFKFKGELNYKIKCITQDKYGTFWLGTEGGGVYSFENGRFIQRITKENGLFSNFCNAIISDKNNNIWILNTTGIVKFSPKTRKVFQFKTINGLEVKNLTSSLVTVGTDKVYFGVKNKIIQYSPDIDALTEKDPILKIKGVDLFFEKVDWKLYTDSVSEDGNLPNNLVLKYNKNHLNFRFAALTFRSPNEVFYRYKLDGFDQTWSLPTEQNYASYANLPPGNYAFRVSSKSSTNWTKPEVLTFEISSPFWKTWWFLTSMILSGIFSVVFTIHFRTKRLKTKQIFLQKQKNALLTEIKERKIAEGKMIESKKELSVAYQKLTRTNKELSTFIYRSSHDLKGPLTSILGLTNLGEMEASENTKEYFIKIAQTTAKLNNILKQLARVTEIKDWKVEPVPINFEELINELVAELSHTHDTSIIKKEVNVPKDFYSDYQLIFITLKALLENSFRYAKPNFETSICLSVGTTKTGVKIEIKDNGIGIRQELQEKVFEMFFKGTERSSGFGLGLYIVSNCLDKLKSTYVLKSKEYEFTSISLFIPNLKKA